MGDLQSCFMDVRPLAKVTEAIEFMRSYCCMCMKYKVLSSRVPLCPYLLLYCSFVVCMCQVSFSLSTIMFTSLTQPVNSVPRRLMVRLLMFSSCREGIIHKGTIPSTLISVSLSLYQFSFCISPKPAQTEIAQPPAHRSPTACTGRSRNVKCYICMHINGA